MARVYKGLWQAPKGSEQRQDDSG